jgi:hypothetical protein
MLQDPGGQNRIAATALNQLRIETLAFRMPSRAPQWRRADDLYQLQLFFSTRD